MRKINKTVEITMVKTIILALTLISIQSFASTPTIDSLLRNGNNPEIGNNTLIANLKIQQITRC